jgi:hypothetical protein
MMLCRLFGCHESSVVASSPHGSDMPLEPKLKHRIERVLSTVDAHGSLGKRLSADALRLWRRLGRFQQMGLISPEASLDAMELGCYAMQLPPRQEGGIATGRLGRTNLKDRCEQAAELLVTLLANDVEEKLMDRTTRMLLEMPQRSPAIDEAKLLADATNLDDFGMTGLVVGAIQMALQGDGVTDVAAGLDKREQYGYWEARLKDGFHYEPVRQIARRRLEHARTAAKMLAQELSEDGAGS